MDDEEVQVGDRLGSGPVLGVIDFASSDHVSVGDKTLSVLTKDDSDGSQVLLEGNSELAMGPGELVVEL